MDQVPVLRAILALTLPTIVCAASLQPVDLAAIQGMPLPEARKLLLSHGWEPRDTGARSADGKLKREFGDAGVLFRLGYAEVEMCSGTGRNICVFNYTRQVDCLQLQTVGEWHSPQGVPKVHALKLGCR